MQDMALCTGLYKGAVPNMVRASLVTAAQVASYDHSKTLILRHNLMEEGTNLFVVCGLISGVRLHCTL